MFKKLSHLVACDFLAALLGTLPACLRETGKFGGYAYKLVIKYW